MNLERMSLANPGVFDQTEVEGVDAVRTKNAAARITDRIRSRHPSEKTSAAGRLNLPHRHSGEIERCVQERPDGRPHPIASDYPPGSLRQAGKSENRNVPSADDVSTLVAFVSSVLASTFASGIAARVESWIVPGISPVVD